VNGSAARWNAWGQHFAVAAAYAACYEVTRHVSFSHWTLTAGLRLACLLLMPSRYWPALAVGEMLPLIESALLCMPKLGGAWAASASVPMIVLFMGCVKPLLQRWPLRGPDGRVRMTVILAATLGCSVITACSTSVTLATALLASPEAWPGISVRDYFWAYLLGAYLGALTVTPAILALHERSEALGQVTWTAVWRSRILRDLVLWALPVTILLAALTLDTTDEPVRQAARLALMLPVLGLALRHGWHGTAFGGMAASIALAATGTVLLDAAMIQCQVLLAVFISGALLVGARAHSRVVRAPATSPQDRGNLTVP
jgi:glucose-6-phosphate-specific signal transduction histidine kinase